MTSDNGVSHDLFRRHGVTTHHEPVSFVIYNTAVFWIAFIFDKCTFNMLFVDIGSIMAPERLHIITVSKYDLYYYVCVYTS